MSSPPDEAAVRQQIAAFEADLAIKQPAAFAKLAAQAKEAGRKSVSA